MTTVAQGSSVTLSLSPADAVTLTGAPNCEGTVVVTRGGQSFVNPVLTLGPLTYRYGPTSTLKTFGPFDIGATLTITAVIGSVDYALLSTELGLTSAQVVSTQALVSGAGTTTWANRASVLTAGLTNAFFTDVGVGGSFWFYGGGRWRPSAGRCTLKNTVANVTNATSSKVVMDYATLLAGLWQDGDVLQIDFLKERTGGSSDTDTTDLCLGTVAGTAGTTLGYSSGALTALALTAGSTWKLRRESATSVRRQTVLGHTSLGTSTANNNAVTVSDMDAATSYLQITSQLTTAAGEVSNLRGYTVTLIAGA